MRILSLLALAPLAAAGVAGAASAECLPGPFAMTLPAQRLDARLQDLAHKTGCFVDVDLATIRGQRAPALRGRLTTDQAFFRSVAGTGLEAGPVQGHWRVDRAQQDAFAKRIATLSAAVDRRRGAGTLTAQRAAALQGDMTRIQRSIAARVREQGFLSAAERASYTAMLDHIDRLTRA